MTPFVLIHSFFICVAFIVSFPILFGTKGTKRHKLLGWIFTSSMLVSVIATFFIPSFGHFSPIHLLSVLVLFWLINGVLAARFKKGNWRYTHAMSMGSAYIAIIIAGIGVLVRYSFTPVNYINGYIASGITALIVIPLMVQRIKKYKSKL